MQMDLNHFSAFITDTSYLLKELFLLPFYLGLQK